MTVVIFAFGVLVFLITVYGTVIVGGLYLTGRQLDDNAELVAVPSGSEREAGVGRAQPLVTPKY